MDFKEFMDIMILELNVFGVMKFWKWYILIVMVKDLGVKMIEIWGFYIM